MKTDQNTFEYLFSVSASLSLSLSLARFSRFVKELCVRLSMESFALLHFIALSRFIFALEETT